MNTSEKQIEIDLIEACKKGDKVAFKALYDKHADTMYAICLRYMNNTDEAKDALQEGFIKVYRNLEKFTFKGSFEGWLKRIFVNTSIELIRKRKHHLDIEEAAVKPSLSGNLAEARIDADRMMALIQQLPHGYRTVFNMYVIDGYSHKEISEQLNITESTSKSQLFKARKQLQEWLAGWFEK